MTCCTKILREDCTAADMNFVAVATRRRWRILLAGCATRGKEVDCFTIPLGHEGVASDALFYEVKIHHRFEEEKSEKKGGQM